MDWFPLYNSLRVALISTFITFFLGIFAAHYIAKTPRLIKGVLDGILTLPLVLPPTVIGFFLLKIIGPLGPVGSRVLEVFGFKLTMTWYSAVFATTIISFPLIYRTARGAFESFDSTLLYSGQTLGLSNTFLFWRVVMPNCKQGILAGAVLSFARALGEFGATTMVSGYIPGRTAIISTTVYQLWREGNDALAYKWVFINLIISFIVLVMVNMLENSYKQPVEAAKDHFEHED
ncbi:MAG: Molybdenum transport system permease protein ModB [Synergistaceae bacterium]|jgi:molybdate transport system permease protein|nr:molybdate ABC transporter permease subunit [Synergistaceae bacterium]MBP9975723.1 molybdate ABC transporter permease subunit [Synergistaceae bacterium]MCE5183879.1 molybdate ABC transporter permease subunit [Synergistaceae bacterium]